VAARYPRGGARAGALPCREPIKRPVDAVENSRASFPPRPQAIT
jgi:hypothetical protein